MRFCFSQLTFRHCLVIFSFIKKKKSVSIGDREYSKINVSNESNAIHGLKIHVHTRVVLSLSNTSKSYFICFTLFCAV